MSDQEKMSTVVEEAEEAEEAPTAAVPAPIDDEPKPQGPRWKVLITLGVLMLVLALAGTTFLLVRKARVEAAMFDDLQRGYALMEEGRPDDARRLIGPWVQAHPDDVEAKYAYARANRQVEQPEGRHILETIGFLRQILDVDPNHVDAKRDLVELSSALNLTSEVLRMTSEVAPEPSADPVFLQARSVALVSTGDLAAALDYAKAFNEAKPGDLIGQVRTLEILRADRVEPAVIIARADEVAAGLSDAQGKVVRGFAARINGEHDRALELAKQAAAAPETDIDFVTALVNLLDGYGEYALSLSVLEAAADVEDTDALIRFAERLWEGGRFAELVRRTDGLDPTDATVDARLLGLRGYGLIGLGRRSEIGPIVDGLAARPEGTRSEAWAAVLPAWPDPGGLFAIETADVDEALTAAQAALRLNQHASFEYLLGVALARSGEPVAAAEHLQVAARLAPSWSEPAVEHLRTLVGSGRGNDAVDSARVLLQRGRQDPSVLATVAEAIARLSGDVNSKGIDDALGLLDRALELDPEAVEPRVLKANLLAEREQNDDAAALLEPLLADPAVFADVPRAAIRASQLGRRLGLDTTALVNAPQWSAGDNRVAFARERAVGAESEEAARAAFGLAETADPDVALALADIRLAFADDRTETGKRIAELAEQFPDRVDIQQRAAAASATLAQRRAAVERLIEMVGPYGLNWPTTSAVLVMQQADEQGRTLPEKELAEVALRVAAVTRAYEQAIEPRLVLAEVLTRLDNRAEAIDQVIKATDIAPTNVPLRLKLAEMHQREGQYPEADRQLRAVEELVDRPSARVSDGERRLLAQLLTGAGEAERAVRVLEGLPRQGDLPDIQLLELYRRQGAMDPDIIAKLLESGDTQQLLFVIDYFASRGDQENLALALDRLTSSGLSAAELARVRGDAAARGGDLATAAESYRAALTEDPTNRETWRRLIITHLGRGEIDAAIASAEQAAANLENNAGHLAFAEKLRAAADSANLLRDIPQVTELLVTLLINDADNDAAVGAIDLLIAARADDRQLSDLARDLAAVAADAPRLYELQDLVARIALLAGQWQIAYEAADVSARFNPTRIEPARFAAEAKANAGAWEEVIELARRWEQRSISAGVDPLPAVLLRARARLAQNQASRTLALLRAYRQQMNDEPQQYAEVIAVYSEALLRRNSGAEALPLLEPLLAEQPFARRLYVQIVSGQWPDVQDAQAKLELVGPMMISGEPAERVLLAKAWKQLEDRGAEPGRFAELLADAAAQLLASDEPASDGLFVETAMLGTTLLDPADLQRLYERALEINPDNPIALNNLAMQLLDVGDPAALNRALAHAEKVAAMDEHPAHAYFLDTLASVQVARDELSAAARTLYEATQVDPRNPRWYAHLAEVQLAQELRDAAASNYREARRLADSLRTIEPETQAALERLEAEFQ